MLNLDISNFENSVDPDQLASEQDPHCFSVIQAANTLIAHDESHVEQLLVDSMLCFSFDRPVTDNCPILIFKKKMYKIQKILPAASSCTHLISTEMNVI